MRKTNELKLLSAIVTIASALIINLSSCKDEYLNVDQYIYDMTNLDSVFKDQERLLQYINGVASYLPDEDRLWPVSH